MATGSSIEWTDATWNPVTGCTKVSQGCKNCYAERMAHRLQAMALPKYRAGFKVAIHPGTLEEPLRWRKPRRVFVCSMSDLFHEQVPAAFIRKVFEVMNAASRHTFQLLTKRPHRAAEIAGDVAWGPNIWVGTSIEDQRVLQRLAEIKRVPACIRFLSLEPLLGPLPTLSLEGIEWVIVGGESGPRARAMQPAWVRDIRDQCLTTGVPFFFKQWGGVWKKHTGRMLDGKTWDEFPTVLPEATEFTPSYSLSATWLNTETPPISPSSM